MFSNGKKTKNNKKIYFKKYFSKLENRMEIQLKTYK